MRADDVIVKSNLEFFGALLFMIGCTKSRGTTTTNMVSITSNLFYYRPEKNYYEGYYFELRL